MNLLDLAEQFAIKHHAGQTYGEHDYMYHLYKVRDSLRHESDTRLPVIALLHDILEDTACTVEELLTAFGEEITYAVVVLSKVRGEPYEAYIAKVLANPLARVVKMHDTLCNLTESLYSQNRVRIVKYARQMQLLAN